MGQVIQKLAILQKYQSKKHSQINPSTYILQSTAQDGTIVICQNNQNGLLLNQSICSQKYYRIKDQFKQWINNNYTYSCNIVKYNLSTESCMCSSSIDTKIIMEYGQGSVLQLIENNNSSKISLFSHQQSQSQQNCYFTNVQILNLIKFMIDAVQEQREKNKVWVQFHIKKIRYFKAQKKFKYLYIPSLEQTHYSQTFFAPEKCTSNKFQMEKSCIFSIGMVLLSIFIEQDCSDCYNYQQNSFCSSIFQSKIQKMQEKLVSEQLVNIVNMQESKVPKIFQQDLAELIITLIHKKQNRAKFLELKQSYYKLVKKASVKYGLTGKKQANDNQSVKRISFKTVVPGDKMIETKQFLYNKSKISLKDISNLSNGFEKPPKINSALKLKQIMSSKYPQKQNFNILN